MTRLLAWLVPMLGEGGMPAKRNERRAGVLSLGAARGSAPRAADLEVAAGIAMVAAVVAWAAVLALVGA